MLTKKEAARLGIAACADKLGRSFVKKYAESSSSAYGEVDGKMYCFVGVEDHPEKYRQDGPVVLDDNSRFPYRASCYVSRKGEITFNELVLPDVQ